jgi:four helix bundle protein
MQDYHQLDIWNRAMDYAVAVYEFASALLQQEKYNMASQLRRAGDIGTFEYRRGLRHGNQRRVRPIPQLAYRSLKEVVTGLELCERLYPLLAQDRVKTLINE